MSQRPGSAPDRPPATTHPGAVQRGAVRIGLLGMYGSVNLGDTAIQMAVMGALTQRRPDVEFIAVCTDPGDASRTYGIAARHISGFGPLQVPGLAAADAQDRWASAAWPVQRAAALARIWRHVRTMDMILVSGSGQIDDFWGGPWEQPFRLWAWSRSARLQGKPVACFGVGVDQLLTTWGRRLAKAALAQAELRVFRDAGSLDALHALGFHAPCEVCPDPAFSLQAPVPVQDPGEPAYAVVSPIARNAWPGAMGPSYETYLRTMAAAADLMQERGLQVRFVCSQTRMDPPVILEVQARMRTDAGRTLTRTPQDVAAYLREVQAARVVLAARLHALILAIVAGAPVVGVSYARKVRQQMADAGLADHCFDFDTLEPPVLLERLQAAIDGHEALRLQVQATAARLRAAIGERFDRLAALIPPPER